MKYVMTYNAAHMYTNPKLIKDHQCSHYQECRDTRIQQTSYNIKNIFLSYCYSMNDFCCIYMVTLNITFITMFILHYRNQPLHVTTPRVCYTSISSTNANMYVYHRRPQLVILFKWTARFCRWFLNNVYYSPERKNVLYKKYVSWGLKYSLFLRLFM